MNPAEEIARIVAQVRGRWPKTRILVRADSGFAHEASGLDEVGFIEFAGGFKEGSAAIAQLQCSKQEIEEAALRFGNRFLLCQECGEEPGVAFAGMFVVFRCAVRG